MESGAGADLFAGGGEMGALMRAHDWSRTPLGPPETWSQSLKVVVRIMLTSRYAMWLAWGPELTFFCNDAYRPTLGVKQPWALGSPATRVWAEIWKDIGPRIETVLATGVATYDEALLLFLERSGYREETYHTFSYSPVPDGQGGVGGMLCVVTEDTERVLGGRRLAFLRDLAADVASIRTEDEAVAAICERLGCEDRDLPFTVVFLFEAAGERARLACTTRLPDGHPAAPATIDTGDAGAPWPLAELLARAGQVTVDDLPARFADLPAGAWDKAPSCAVLVPIAQQGHERPAGCLVVGLNPYRAFDAAYAGFLDLVAGQIASALASARAYEEERRRAEALAELDRAKTAFFSNISHEFRTPLTLMLGPLEDVLGRPDLAPDLREPLDLAHRNGLRLLRLVNTLLDFSRIEAGRTQASYEPVDLGPLTADLASSFRSACERAGLVLTVDCRPLAGPAHVDRDMWEKIVLNLLSNAFKFTFEGGIAVTLRDGGQAVTLEVEDSGVGIPPAELPRVFERFHRIEGQRARTHEGTGIGLALVHELVRLHGGQIDVRSTPGRGTTFTVTIPKGTAHLPPERIGAPRTLASTAASVDAFIDEALRWLPDQHTPAAARPTKVPGGTPALGRRRILLADDNADMRDYVRRLLSATFEVEAVADGAQALEAARARPPDLVLSDVMMPGLDGFELLAALRADPRTRELPVIMLSARAGEEARVEGLEAGADDYLTKPFSARELVARVEAHLRLAELRAETARAVHMREERLRLLLHELSHRVKNILAVIQSVATQTGARALTLDAFLQSFRGRLQALAAAHEILTAAGWQAAGLAALARATLAPYLGDGRISLDLEDAPVAPSVAQTTALALHELATNAVKHGALSVEGGRVTIDGRVIDGDRLVVNWCEEGGPATVEPATNGFGMTLLTRAIRHQHKGEVALDWRPEGLRCRITLPVAPAGGPLPI